MVLISLVFHGDRESSIFVRPEPIEVVFSGLVGEVSTIVLIVDIF